MAKFLLLRTHFNLLGALLVKINILVLSCRLAKFGKIGSKTDKMH